MKVFKKFPKIDYPTEVLNGSYSGFVKCTNIMVSVRLREALRKNTVFFYDYRVTDQDRPDIIASKYYGSADYTWLVFYANDIIDPQYDWPLTIQEFNEYILKKYGSVDYAYQNIKHYLNDNGYIIDYDTWLSTPENSRSEKSIYDWEEELNDEKRNIRLVDNLYLNKVLSELNDILKEIH